MGEELLRTVLDVDRSSITTLNLRQWINIGKYLPEYSVSKIKPSEYNYKQDPYIGIYERESFNEYGDAYIHWTRSPGIVQPHIKIQGKFNQDLIDYILVYEQKVEEAGAILYLTFPCLQAESFNYLEDQISNVENEMQLSGLDIIGSAKRYRFAPNLFHDTPYHMTYEGVILRTEYLLEDLKTAGLRFED